MTSFILSLALIGQVSTQEMLRELHEEINTDYTREQQLMASSPRVAVHWNVDTIPMALEYMERLNAINATYHGAKRQHFTDKLSVAFTRKYRLSESQFADFVCTLGSKKGFQDLVVALHLARDVREALPPLHVGIARMTASKCTCGVTMGKASAVCDPTKLRYVDDISPALAVLAKDHKATDHDIDGRDNNRVISELLFFHRIDIKEVIRPEDPRYHNHEVWVRATVGGKTMFVQGRGLRNTEY